MSEHTPGPWHVAEGDAPHWCIEPAHMIERDLPIIAWVWGDAAEGSTPHPVRANARLIAAAPEMYAVCEAVLALEPHMALCEVGEDCATCRDLTFRAQDLAEAAIRKVRGEQL